MFVASLKHKKQSFLLPFISFSAKVGERERERERKEERACVLCFDLVVLLLTHSLTCSLSLSSLHRLRCLCRPLIFTSLVGMLRGGDGRTATTATPAAYKNARSIKVVLSAMVHPEMAPLSEEGFYSDRDRFYLVTRRGREHFLAKTRSVWGQLHSLFTTLNPNLCSMLRDVY